MLHEIGSDLVETVIRRDDLVVLPEQLFEQSLLIRIELSLGDGVGDSVVQVQPGDSELLAAVFINKLTRGAVFFGALEVVSRDVCAENALRQVVMLEQGRAGEADKGDRK